MAAWGAIVQSRDMIGAASLLIPVNEKDSPSLGPMDLQPVLDVCWPPVKGFLA